MNGHNQSGAHGPIQGKNLLARGRVGESRQDAFLKPIGAHDLV